MPDRISGTPSRPSDARRRVLLLGGVIAFVGIAALAVLALIPGVLPRATDRDPNRVASVLARTIATRGIDAAVAEYRMLKARGFPGLVESEAETNTLGYTLLRNGDVAAAIAVFRLNIETHPDSANVHDSLGEAYLTAGNRTEALTHYEKALQIDPRKKSAVSAVSTLTGRQRHYPPLVLFHIVNGVIGLVSGAAAMLLRKGSRWHGGAGRVFVGSMLSMAASAAYIDAFVDPYGRAINILMGLLTFYLVATAWLAARRRQPQVGVIDWVALAGVVAIGIGLARNGIEAAGSETGRVDGASAGIFFAFTAVAALAAGFDIRGIRRGGLSGAQRLTQHLWRMCVALFVAVTSLFLGQPQLFPVTIRNSGVLAVPSLLVILSLGYWLYRVNASRRPFSPARISVTATREAH